MTRSQAPLTLFWTPLSALVLGAVLAGCGMTDQQPTGGGINLGEALNLSCLDPLPEQLIALAEGRLKTDSEVEAPFLCMDRALEIFVTYTRGESADFYTPEELRRFLNRHFTTVDRVSAALMGGAMNLKAAVLGGPRDRITRKDLLHLRSFLNVVRQEAVRLKQVIPLFQGGRSIDPETAIRTASLLEASAENLGTLLETAANDYTLEQLNDFLSELRSFIHEKEGGSIGMFQRYLPLMRGAKSLVFGNEGNAIQAREWKPLLRVGAHLGAGYLTWTNAPSDLRFAGEGGARLVAALAQSFAGAVRQIPGARETLSGEDQRRFRDEIIAHLQKHQSSTEFSQWIGLGLLGARVLFGNAEGEIVISQIERLPTALRATARLFDPLGDWLERGGVGAFPYVTVEAIAQIFGDYLLSRRDPLDEAFVLASLEFTRPLVSETDRFRSFVPLLFAGKYFATGKAVPQIAGISWKTLIQTAAEAGSVLWLFRSHVLNSPHSWRSDGFHTGLRIAVTATLDALTRIARRHPNGTISFDAFDHVLAAGYHFAEQSGIELPLSLRVLGSTLRPVFRHALAGYDLGTTGRLARGLSIPSIRRARVAFLKWSITQSHIEMAFLRNVRNEDIDQALVPLSSFAESVESLKANRITRPSGLHLEKLLSIYPRILALGEFKLYFPSSRAETGLRSFTELSIVNVLTTVIELIGKGYTSEPATAELSLSRAEVQRAFEDFFPVLLDVGIIETDDLPNEFAESIARDGNFFPSTANGDGRVQVGEAVEMILHVFSAQSLRDQIADKIEEAHCRVRAPDPHGKHVYPPACVRRLFLEDEAYFVNLFRPYLPRFIEEYSAFSPREKQTFRNSLMKVARSGQAADYPLKRSQIKRMVHILQYAESIYQRLDTDWSNRLERYEAMAAFPLFERDLAEATGKSGYELQAIFGYIIRYGIPPKEPNSRHPLANIARVTGYLGWLLNWRISGIARIDIQLTRLKLVTLFAELSSN